MHDERLHISDDGLRLFLQPAEHHFHHCIDLKCGWSRPTVFLSDYLIKHGHLCRSLPTTASVFHTALSGALSTYTGPPQSITTQLFSGEIFHYTIFTLVASQFPRYAASPGIPTVISTTSTWGEATTETVASNGWV